MIVPIDAQLLSAKNSISKAYFNPIKYNAKHIFLDVVLNKKSYLVSIIRPQYPKCRKYVHV